MQELKGLLSSEVRYVQDEAISFDTEKFIDFKFGNPYGKSNLNTPIRCVKGYRGKVKGRITQATPALISLCIIANRASLTRRALGLIIDRALAFLECFKCRKRFHRDFACGNAVIDEGLVFWVCESCVFETKLVKREE